MNIPRNYKDASAFLGDKMEKFIRGKRSTKLVASNDSIGLQYHGTTVVTFYKDGSAKLNTGGWRSKTTKLRINQAIGSLGGVFQKNWEWFIYLYKEDRTIPFEDGMVINKLVAFA